MAEGNCVPGPDHPCRVNLDLMPKEQTVLWMWLLTAVALAVFAYGVWQMVHVWRMGRPWQPGDWRRGLRRMVVSVLTHRRVMRQRQPGTMHAWIFFGFVVLFIGTTLAFIDMDVFEMLLDSKLLYGRGYLVYEAVLDAFGVVFVMGVLYALKRRLVDRPKHLHRSELVESPVAALVGGRASKARADEPSGAAGGAGHAEAMGVSRAPAEAPLAPPGPLARRPRGDLYALWLLLLIGLSGFFLEAMRLQHQVRNDGITYASWSFVGYALGPLVKPLSDAQMMQVYPVVWWTHFALWTAVLAVLPWTKLKHILTGSLNLFFHDPDRQARPDLPTPFSLKEMMESEATEMPPVGYATIRDFTWKDRLALDACMNCGRCESQCPATAAGRPLSPRKLIQDLKAHMWQDYRDERAHRRAGKEYAPQRLTMVSDLKVQVEEATLWSCTTCRACMTECPVEIEHVDLIVEMRRALVNESRLDEHQQKLLVNMTNAGNPYGFPMSDRDAWRGGLPPGVVVPTAAERLAENKPFEWLWWVGCVGSFDPRNQKVTRDLATIYNAAGLDFAILGTEERCNGDPARRLGEEGRFQQSVLENLAALEPYGVKKVVTQCPHCFNTLANEYPRFGAAFVVVHHSQLIERLLAEGRLPMRRAADGEAAITFHDSCYLGRHNGIYDAPRAVLREASGLPLLEMAMSGSNGLCCGAGGSNMWYEVKDERERINVIRAKQAEETGAATVASACPFCLTMISDGIGLTGNEGRMVAKDIAEIVAENLDWTPPAQEAGEAPAAAAAADPVWSG